MEQLSPDVLDAFDVNPNISTLPIERADQTTGVWRCGDVVVKRVRWDVPDWWVRRAIAGLELELAAIDAGVRAPQPVLPRVDAIGPCVVIDGVPYRAHVYVPNQPVTSDDEIGTWLAGTLALLHSVAAPAMRPEPSWNGLHPIAEWTAWIERGGDAGLPWAEDGHRSIDAIGSLSRVVEHGLRGRTWHIAHRDVNPWNVAVSSEGPVLFDFDSAGPDVLALEAAAAADAFGFDADPEAMEIRRAETWLNWTAFNMWLSLGDRAATELERDAATRIVTEQLVAMPVPEPG